MTIDPRLHRIVAAQPYPLLFATISGAHLYGFPSPDSDFDLRGAHVLPLEKVVGLELRDETVEQSFVVPPHPGPFHEPRRSGASAERRRLPERENGGALPKRRYGSGAQCADFDPANSLPQGGEGGGLEMDIVSHDVRKFFGLLLKKNGYVLEQLFSPLIVQTTPEHEELKAICNPRQIDTSPGAIEQSGRRTSSDHRPPSPQSGEGNLPDRGGEGYTNHPSPHPSPLGGERGSGGRVKSESGVITKHHSHHYFGFAETQWNLFLKESPRRVKPLLYVYRVLLTGIHLMRTGRVEANLVTLNEEFRLPYIPDLVARKLAGPEKSKLPDADIAFHESEYQRLRRELQAAHDASQLPESPSDETRKALNDLLVPVRLKSYQAAGNAFP